jgi:hypothetical protein
VLSCICPNGRLRIGCDHVLAVGDHDLQSSFARDRFGHALTWWRLSAETVRTMLSDDDDETPAG